MKRLIILLALPAVVMGACSEFQTYSFQEPAPVVSEEHRVGDLLAELHLTRTMSQDQLLKTLESCEQRFRDDPSTYNRLKLALLYATANQPVRDLGRAQKLLDESAAGLDSAGAQELVSIVRQFLDEQIESNRKINDLNKEIAEQNKRIAELEQQQRALTRIEQKIQERDNPEETGNGN
jgi:ABC-type hemin transport system ATPase subunit